MVPEGQRHLEAHRDHTPGQALELPTLESRRQARARPVRWSQAAKPRDFPSSFLVGCISVGHHGD